MRSYPMGDMTDQCAGHVENTCEGEKCASDCFIGVPDAEPRSGRRLFVPPKKFKSKLHKKMHKMEVAFDKAEGRPSMLARINKSAESLQKKIDLLEGKEKKEDGGTDKDRKVS